MNPQNIRERTRQFCEENKMFDIVDIINNLEKVIENFGVNVLYSNMSTFSNPDNISGYSLVNEEGKPEIVVNVNHVEGRRRFTMAHELGHIVLHWDYPHKKLNKEEVNILYRDNFSEDTKNEQEAQANEFAAQLLIPLEIMEEALPKPINKYDDVEFSKLVARVSKVFNVTRPFARRQLEKMRDEFNEEKL